MTPSIKTNLTNAYHSKSEFNFFSRNTIIPEALKAKGTENETRMYPAGIGNAILCLLNDQVAVYQTDKGIEVAVQGESVLLIDDLRWTSRSLSATNIINTPIAGLVMALTGEHLPQTSKALRQLVSSLGNVGLAFPVDLSKLKNSTNNDKIKNALMHTADCLAYELEQLEIEWEPHLNLNKLGKCEQVNLAVLIRERIGVDKRSTPDERLGRLVKRGGAALLIGPPGTFKTESAKRVALENKMRLVIAKGAPGVEDRDFIGGLYPAGDESKPVWIDGPLSRAFVAAAAEPTLLLVDEVLRYHAENLNVIIGAMDTVSTAEALAIGVPQENLSPNSERHYLLSLPNGEVLTAPYANLIWAFTTNIGGDHLQTADRFDGALLSRLDHIIEFTFPDRNTALNLYGQFAADEEMASMAYRAEVLTRQMMQELEKPLARSLEARKTLGLIKEWCAVEEEGVTRNAAFMDAFRSVAVPYCVPRDMDGALDADIINLLETRIREELLLEA